MDHRPTPQGDATMTPAQLTAWMDSLRLNTVKASQALGISRIVHKLGYKVVLFSRYKISITRFSNTVAKFVLYKDDQDLHMKDYRIYDRPC